MFFSIFNLFSTKKGERKNKQQLFSGWMRQLQWAFKLIIYERKEKKSSGGFFALLAVNFECLQCWRPLCFDFENCQPFWVQCVNNCKFGWKQSIEEIEFCCFEIMMMIKCKISMSCCEYRRRLKTGGFYFFWGECHWLFFLFNLFVFCVFFFFIKIF